LARAAFSFDKNLHQKKFGVIFGNIGYGPRVY
jgi:hypothetical protein